MTETGLKQAWPEEEKRNWREAGVGGREKRVSLV